MSEKIVYIARAKPRIKCMFMVQYKKERYYVMVKLGEWNPEICKSVRGLFKNFNISERKVSKWKSKLDENGFVMEDGFILMRGKIMKDTRGGATKTSGLFGRNTE